MRFDWKKKFENQAFVIAFCTAVIAFVYQMLGMFEVTPQISQNDVVNFATTVINFVWIVGITINPNTNGISDAGEGKR